jgi:hypothetical protein
VERPIRRRVVTRRNPLLIFYLLRDESIPCHTSGHNVCLADYARRMHARWYEYIFAKKVTIELSGDTPNDHAEECIAEIAVLKVFTWPITARKRCGEQRELVLGVVASEIQHEFIIRQSRCVR